MAVQEHFEGFDQEKSEISRSAHKREAQAIRKLADKIADLGTQSFNSLNFLDEDLKEAFLVARKLKKISDERRRQLQYVAKIMRSCDLADLKRQIDNLGATKEIDPNAMRLENLRENLIYGGIKTLNEFCSLILDIDRNKLRVLVKKANDELTSTAPDRPAARELYKFLKKEVNRAAIELPDSLTKKIAR